MVWPWRCLPGRLESAKHTGIGPARPRTLAQRRPRKSATQLPKAWANVQAGGNFALSHTSARGGVVGLELTLMTLSHTGSGSSVAHVVDQTSRAPAIALPLRARRTDASAAWSARPWITTVGAVMRRRGAKGCRPGWSRNAVRCPRAAPRSYSSAALARICSSGVG